MGDTVLRPRGPAPETDAIAAATMEGMWPATMDSIAAEGMAATPAAMTVAMSMWTTNTSTTIVRAATTPEIVDGMWATIIVVPDPEEGAELVEVEQVVAPQ